MGVEEEIEAWFKNRLIPMEVSIKKLLEELKQEQYSLGCDEGFNRGYDDGYQEGYKKGKEEGREEGRSEVLGDIETDEFLSWDSKREVLRRFNILV